jgi:hypothetical protein
VGRAISILTTIFKQNNRELDVLPITINKLCEAHKHAKTKLMFITLQVRKGII